jgi:hypothetical protein
MSDQHNPKASLNPGSNTRKDPDDWVSGEEPMTGAQRSHLKTLLEQAHEPETCGEDLTKAQASRRNGQEDTVERRPSRNARMGRLVARKRTFTGIKGFLLLMQRLLTFGHQSKSAIIGIFNRSFLADFETAQ